MAEVFASPNLFFKILLITTTAYYLATLAWYYTFRREEREKLPSIAKLFLIRNIGESVSILTPINVVGGEYSKVLLLEKYGLDKLRSTQATILARVLIILSFILLGFLVVSYLLSSLSVIYMVLFVLFVFLLLLTVRSIYHKSVPSTKSSEKHGWIDKIKLKVYDFLYRCVKSIQEDRRSFLIALFLSALHWLIGSLEFLTILHFLEIPISYFQAVVVEFGVMVFKSAGAFVPGQIGVEEYGNKLMLQSLGVTSLKIWVSVSVIRRIRQLAWIIIGSIAALFTLKIRLWKFSL